MKMEEPGTEVVKRQRLEHYGESPPLQRVHEQQPEGPLPPPLHTYPGSQALRPPSAYSRPPPPSPYNANHDPRAHHEHPPPPGSYDHHRSGYNTPIRDRPPPPDTNPHHGIPSTSAQSPERLPGVALRPLNTAFEPGPPHYSHHPGHEGVEPPPAYPPEHPNGMYHGLPAPQGHMDSAHHPPPVPAYSEPPGQHGPPYSAGPFTGPPAAPPWVHNRQYQPQPPKKGTRAQQACEMCRQRKARCDEGKPTCGYCKENGTTCVYKEMQAPKADRAQKEIMDELRKNEDRYEKLQSDFKHLDAKVDRVEQHLSDIAKAIHGNNRKDSETREPKVESPVVSHIATQGNIGEPTYPEQDQAEPNLLYHKPNAPVNDNVEETSAGVSVHIDHTTAVHRLFRWPLIAALFADRRVPKENYVMDNEQRKGLLRIYGKGQGVDRYDGALSGAASSPISSISGEDPSQSPSTSSEDDLWGYELGYPHTIDGRFFNNEKDHPGGLTFNGTLKLDRLTMHELLDSYLANIHILHPFLDKTRLKRMIEKVHRDYKSRDPDNSAHPPDPTTYTQQPRPLKRKHSNDDQPQETGNTAIPNHAQAEPKLPRRVSTAVVLLVMALGKMCLHTKPLPGFAGDVSKEGPNSSHATSPENHTLSPSTTVSSPMSAGDIRGRARHPTSISGILNHGSPRRGDRNIDVIPGLGYFAKAMEILGTLPGNDLQYVQANLLAGIYTAQLACVIESWTWIQHACRACYFLVVDPTFAKERDHKKVDLIRFAYLTCLQLESDILAELDLRPSGIHDIDAEDKISLPKGVVDDATDLKNSTGLEDPIIVYYSYQLQLRKWLNRWQKVWYPASGSELLDQKFKAVNDTFSIFQRNACEASLSSFRDVMQRMHSTLQLHWNDWDEPASDINAARLRGKYYGAKYIVHRPFLYYALHHFDENHLSKEAKDLFKGFDQNRASAFAQDRPPPNSDQQARQDWLVAQMLLSCRVCIEAARRSTTSFDGVLKSKRLMVTNIFGTAHAQFGNMLVLAATFTSRHLSWLIHRDDLLNLLNRTIDFLMSLAPISTTLHTDARLLMIVRDKIYGPRISSGDIPHPTSSFGSLSSR